MTEILLYGPIGADMWEPDDSITAKSVIAQLAEIDGDVTVRISSGGGDVYEGIDIMQALRNHPGRVTVIVESLAASAASFIAVGGADEVLMRKSSEMMIHRAMTFSDGNADELSKTLADLERQDMKLASIYAEKAGGQVDDWLEAMGAETWYTSEEAVAAGLADRVVDPKPVPEAQAPAAAMRHRFKFANRAAAPPPPVTRSESGDETTTPSDGQEGDAMSIKNLAQELGVEPDVLREKLSGFFNETVTVSGEVEVTYPTETAIAPTERVTVEPTIGDPPTEDGEGVETSEPQNAVMDAAALGL
ncbi:MAG: Clp protease ClpP, partial [Bacteroidaceae bacterium]|nr:Clp protease ClpP [Bacteroidaceae bacterium]